LEGKLQYVASPALTLSRGGEDDRIGFTKGYGDRVIHLIYKEAEI
jgi:hypothetical protein